MVISDPRIIQFVGKHRIAVLSVEMPDGSIHSATVHYSHKADPFQLCFSTKNDSRKFEAVSAQGACKAAVTIGFSEEEWMTLQLDGELTLVVEPAEIEAVNAVHFTKYPEYRKYETDSSRVRIVFIPHWYRFSDFRAEPRIFVEGP
jgi:general stress protein 26